MTIPVQNPTKTQRDLWEVIEKRVKAIRFRQQVNISQEVGHVLNLPASRLVREIEPIADGLAAVRAPDDSVLVYTQSLLDSYRAQIAVRKTSTSEMQQLRQIVRQWYQRFRGSTVTLIPGSMWEGGVQMDYLDMESLLIDDEHDGWLNGDLIYSVLASTANNYRVIPPGAWTNWVDGGNQRDDMFDVGEGSPNLVIPVYTHNHWSLLIADRDSGVIYFMDSIEDTERRQTMMASLRAFVEAHPAYNIGASWIYSIRRSPPQLNTYDCGIWAIRNAWGWAENNWPTQVGLPDRVQIGRTIMERAEATAGSRLPPPSRDLQIMGMRNLTLTPPRRTSTAPQSANQSFSSTSQVPKRESTPQRLISTARQALAQGSPSGMSNRPTSQAGSREGTPQMRSTARAPQRQLTSPSNVAPPSLPQTPPELHQQMDAGERIQVRGSPLPRTLPARAPQTLQRPPPSQESFTVRKTRSGKEH
jgi:hypothetical protein